MKYAVHNRELCDIEWFVHNWMIRDDETMRVGHLPFFGSKTPVEFSFGGLYGKIRTFAYKVIPLFRP